MQHIHTSDIAALRGAPRTMRLRAGAMAVCTLLLSGCAELAGELIDAMDLGACYGCDWIIQEWDDPDWSTHNSDPYETEELCEQALARRSAESPDRGHRCIYEGDVEGLRASYPEAGFCYGCDWAVQVESYTGWSRIEPHVYHTEGVCQQAAWHLQKDNPQEHYRCVNLDR